MRERVRRRRVMNERGGERGWRDSEKKVGGEEEEEGEVEEKRIYERWLS